MLRDQSSLFSLLFSQNFVMLGDESSLLVLTISLLRDKIFDGRWRELAVLLQNFSEVSIKPHRTPEIFLFLFRTSQKVKLKTASRKLLEKSHVCASLTICGRLD